MPKARAAIVGTGNIAGYHIASLQALGEEAEAVAGVDVDAGRLDAFCDEHGIPGRYTDVEQMLAAERPDLVHICTPPSLHHEQALACLQAGASVLVEKPPTLSLAELDELDAAQGEDGPFMATVFQHRFGSGARRLRALLRQRRPRTAASGDLQHDVVPRPGVLRRPVARPLGHRGRRARRWATASIRST